MAKKKAMTMPAEAAMPSKADKDYEAEDAYRDMERAHQHKQNPDLMERVKKHAGRKHKAISGLHKELGLEDKPKKKEFKSIADLRAHRNEMAMKKA